MKPTFPLIIVNCKAYEKGMGMHAVKLAKICRQVTQQTGICIAIAVQASDIFRVNHGTKIQVLAQHVDYNDYGAHTGSILPEAVKVAGAIGTLINHSEKRLLPKILAKTIARCKVAKLLSIVCVQTPKEAKFAEKSGAEIIAIEDSKLIARNKSIAEIHPSLITSVVNIVQNIPVLCGAGIHSSEDAVHTIQLGAKGVLIANAVVNAKNQKKALMEIARKMQEVSHYEGLVKNSLGELFKKQKRKIR
ncbi:MAG: triose-phosphate isomerase [Candidatus Woesearchaeota archaeon]|nr:triose-phosphate isomerase [Candidatus Woesearchaeota archaeon]